MAAWLLRLHRWIALALMLPLAILLVTGLILSFEPWLVTRAIEPGMLKPEQVEALLARHDPKGQARGIAFRPYDKTLTIGAGRGGGTVVHVVSGEAIPGPSAMASFLVATRRMHERVLEAEWFKTINRALSIPDSWLVVTSTIGMLLLALLGMLMGLPRWSNTLGGWHKTTAWVLLPLVVLSPLTGLFIAWGITFTSPPAGIGGQGGGQGGGQRGGGAIPLVEAVRIVGKSHDLSGLVWIRPQGGGMAARIVEGGEYRGYRVTREGTVANQRNWPRLWHEGNFAGAWSALLNVITSFALIGLLVTGVTMWAQAKLRRAHRRAARGTTTAAQA